MQRNQRITTDPALRAVVKQTLFVFPTLPYAPHRSEQLAKLSAILGTLAAIISMTYVPTMLYASLGISGKFRYAFLVRLATLVAGTTIQLALFTVLAKWILAGMLGLDRGDADRVHFLGCLNLSIILPQKYLLYRFEVHSVIPQTQ